MRKNYHEGHKDQYCDYSKIIRNSKSAIPSKKLLIVFDKYQVASGNSGDFFTVNSYTKERYSKDIPLIGQFNIPASDILDYRPRVKTFDLANHSNSVNVSPFAFSSREFESTNPFVITPNESSLIGFNFYLGRIDKLIVSKDQSAEIIRGESSEFPQPPSSNTDAMEVAQIILPPYLYD